MFCTPISAGPVAARSGRTRASRRLRPELQPLESRQLLSTTTSAVEPSADEQYMVQLVNRARANPPAEGQRLLAIARTDPTIIPALNGWDAPAFLQQMNARGPLPPLAINPRLSAAARDHNDAMVAANAQFHSAPGSLARPTSPSQLAPDGQAYYPIGNSGWATAENVFAYSANLPNPTGKALDDYFHAAFLLDWGNPDFGHLKNLMSPGPSGASAGSYPMNEIGVGILTGARPTSAPTPDPAIPANLGLNVGPGLVTQEFGWRSGHQFLSGAMFADRDGDNFYTPGEGLGGVSIQAVNRDTGATFSGVTWGSGGYALDLPSGSYTVTASGGGLTSPRTTTVRLTSDNVAWDVNQSQTPSSPFVPTIITPITPVTPTTPTAPTSGRQFVNTPPTTLTKAQAKAQARAQAKAKAQAKARARLERLIARRLARAQQAAVPTLSPLR